MPDNQPFVSPLNPPGFFPLDDHSVLALEGPEAIAFAHAQFSSDVSSLAVGHWQWSTWLTAKGRVLAVFALLRTGEHALRLVLPDVDAAELADALRRYVFRRKVTLAARPDLRVTGAFAAPAQARGPLLAGDEADGLELDYGTAALPRTLRLAGGPCATPPASTEAWSVADLRLGLPRLPPSQRGQWTPQQLALLNSLLDEQAQHLFADGVITGRHGFQNAEVHRPRYVAQCHVVPPSPRRRLSQPPA